MTFFTTLNKDFLRFICKTLEIDGTNILGNMLKSLEREIYINEWLSVDSCNHRLIILKYFLRAKLYRLIKDKNEGIRRAKAWNQTRREMRNQ